MADLAEGGLERVLDRLSRVLLDEVALEGLLQLVVELASSGFTGSDAASISLFHGDPVRYETSNATTPEVVKLDAVQYDTRQGPCVTTIETGERIVVDLADESDEWPDFVAAARGQGVGSMFSSPLTVRGGVIGALNLYSHGTIGTGHWNDEAIVTFASTAAVVLANALVFATAEMKTANLEAALVTRDLIGQATGILMARDGLSGEEAFDTLRIRSQHSNRKLRAIAQEIVDELDGSGLRNDESA